MPGFVHLHVHSEYSLLDGACRIKDIPAAAAADSQSAVAITDHGNMFGAVAFYRACKAAGVKPIIGCEVYVAPRTRFDMSSRADSEANHLVLLVMNETGYKNLIFMVSRSYTEGFYSRPRVDMELLREHNEGLIALSACLAGYIPRCILAGNYSSAEVGALALSKIFSPDRFYLEIQDHGMAEQKKVNDGLIGISRVTGIPLVATNDVHYIRKADAETQAVMLCIQTNNVITDGRPIGFETDEFYFKSEAEMKALFGNEPGAIENTSVIADRCNFDFEFGKLYLPAFIPPDGSMPRDYLRERALQGLESRIARGDITFDRAERNIYDERLEYELQVIVSMGYSDYFLIVADFVGYAKEHGIPTGPGRGSGAGSLIAYLLDITDVDPVYYDLLFEAFLNPERVSMPDFDIDFCYDRRDEVIDYVSDKYGADHVCQIITFGTMAARAAVRDAGRALGMSYGETDAVARLIPQRPGVTLEEALSTDALKTAMKESEHVRRLLEISQAIEGMPRHASTHAAGVVITDRPLWTHVPLATVSGAPVTQYDMDTVAALGLLKFDFLGLRYLTVISDTEKLIRERNPEFSLKTVSTEDPETYALISSGRTDGVFQLESAGMRTLLGSLMPSCIEDIMTAIALYRPGPMDSIPKYLENRHDADKITYKIPELAEILDETCGCIVYQEQVMQILRAVAGYTYGRADIVRRAISKKKPGVIEKEAESFISGAVANGHSEDDARELYSSMTGFANYGFKKSHAAAYAVISFRTAYLKAHYPAEYYASLITSVAGNTAKISGYIAECEKMNIKVLPPDINSSEVRFSVDGGNIRFGLAAIKNVGGAFVERIIRERAAGEYVSFYDFIRRMADGELNRRQIEALIKAGSFDRLGVYRSQLLASCEKIIGMFISRDRGKLSGQIDLFGSQDSGFRYPDIPEFSFAERLALEKESSGIYFSGHLLDSFTRHIGDLGAVQIKSLQSEADPTEEGVEPTDIPANGTKVTVAAIITSRVNKLTRNGADMSFLTLEDRFGVIEAVVFPKSVDEYGPLLRAGAAVAVTGELSVRPEEEPKLLLRHIEPLIQNDDYEAARTRRPPAGANNTPQTRVPAPPRQTEPPKRSADSEKEKRLFLRVASMNSPQTAKIINLACIFNGGTRIICRCEDEGKYMALEGVMIDPTEYVIRELKALLGDDSVILK